MKFLKADYLGESNEEQKHISEAVKVISEKEQKMMKEMEKIRKLDAKLA